MYIFRFKNVFNEQVKSDLCFQEKLHQMLSLEDKPNDELFWRKIIEEDESRFFFLRIYIFYKK